MNDFLSGLPALEHESGGMTMTHQMLRNLIKLSFSYVFEDVA